MGIDYDGGMIVGCKADEVSLPEDYEDTLFEWIDENELDYMSPWYDCDIEDTIIGYCVKDVEVSEIKPWLEDIKSKADTFEKLTGIKARLIGTQNIW